MKRVQCDEAVGPWSYKEGIIFFKNRIFLLVGSSLVPIIMEEMHSNTRKGFHKTLQRIKFVFFWKGMKNDIKEHIQQCDTCQCQKWDNTSPAGLLQPLPIPTQLWTYISMDFIEGLPNLRGKSTIYVVVDCLSKFAHFIPISHPYTSSSVAQVFYDNILKMYGMPKSIV